MGRLPGMAYSSGITRSQQVQFGGLRHHQNAGDGEIYDMENMSARDYPLLRSRDKRRNGGTLTGATEMFFDNHAMWYTDADGWLWYKRAMLNLKVAYVGEGETKFVRFGDRIVLMPAKKLVQAKYTVAGTAANPSALPTSIEPGEAYVINVGDTQSPEWMLYVWTGDEWDDSMGAWVVSMEAELTATKITISDGTIYGADATANTLTINTPTSADLVKAGFRVGDAVEIDGLTMEPDNNKIAIIREIGKTSIAFSDYCFKIPLSDSGEKQTSYSEEGTITLRRSVPDMDICFEFENRLWGADKKEIFASALGDPTNFYVFDGLSTDSWYVELQTRGEITGGVGWYYPTFFREGYILRIYGADATTYQTSEILAPGVAHGMQHSLGAAGGLLFYYSPQGMMAYDGDYPQDLQQVFGPGEYGGGLAQSDGTDYYIQLKPTGETSPRIYHYDGLRGIWTVEDSPNIDSMSMTEGAETLQPSIIAMTTGKALTTLKGPGGPWVQDTAAVASFVEFADFTMESPNRKAVSKLLLRLSLTSASVTVKIRYDSSGTWKTVATLTAAGKRSYYLPVVPHRCDHFRIRLEATGEWALHSLAIEYYVGSALH
mgnify:FL=1